MTNYNDMTTNELKDVLERTKAAKFRLDMRDTWDADDYKEDAALYNTICSIESVLASRI